MVLVTHGWIYCSVNDDKQGKNHNTYFTIEFLQYLGLFAQYRKNFKIHNLFIIIITFWRNIDGVTLLIKVYVA